MLLLRRFLLLCPVLTSVACGPSAAPSEKTAAAKPEAAFASDLAPLVASYEKDAAAANAPVQAEFKDQLVQVIWVDDLGQQGEQTVLGRCDRFNENHPDPSQRFRTIKVRRPDAAGKVGSITLDALTLKTIVYHELGHCLHDFRGHLPAANHQIMSSALPDDRFGSFSTLLQQHFALVHEH